MTHTLLNGYGQQFAINQNEHHDAMVAEFNKEFETLSECQFLASWESYRIIPDAEWPTINHQMALEEALEA